MNTYQKPFAPTSIEDFIFSTSEGKHFMHGLLNGEVNFPDSQCMICLHGTFGTGKTTLAKMLPKLLEESGNLPFFDREQNFFTHSQWYHFTMCGNAVNRSNFAEELVKRVTTPMNAGAYGWRYEILDEADMLTEALQKSLKGLADPEHGTIFILTTNHLNRIDPALIDRSKLIEMNRPTNDQIKQKAREWMMANSLRGDELTEEDLDLVAKASKGFRQFIPNMAMLINACKEYT